MVTTERIRELGEVIKWKRVFEEAALNLSTMRSALHQGRPLRPDEAAKIDGALQRLGIILAAVQRDLFLHGEASHEMRA